MSITKRRARERAPQNTNARPKYHPNITVKLIGVVVWIIWITLPRSFSFMHLAEVFIQTDSRGIQAIHLISMCILWELNP